MTSRTTHLPLKIADQTAWCPTEDPLPGARLSPTANLLE